MEGTRDVWQVGCDIEALNELGWSLEDWLREKLLP